MLVTDKFVFLHLPRAGGTFVYDVVRKFFPAAREIGYHFPRELLPREYLHLPILGIVRNPWEFYVSWYHHVRPRGSASLLLSWLSENGKLGLVETIRNAVNLGVNNERLDVLIEMLPEHVDFGRRHIPNITKDSMRKVRGTGVGYYTFRFNHIFGKADDVFFCRLETLRQDLVAFFERIGVASDELRDYVCRLDKKNTTEYAPPSTLYTAELAELVRIRDRQLIDRFGFTFEGYASENKRGAAAWETGPGANPDLMPLDENRDGPEATGKDILLTVSSTRETIMPRKVGHACGKIILSGNISNSFGKRAIAVPVDMHITAEWDKSDNSQEGLRVVWAGQRENSVWMTTVRKICELIEERVGRLSGKLTIYNTLPLGKGMGSSTAIVVALARLFLGKNCKDEAFAIEDAINKGQSGIDFAAIWEERPIVIKDGRYKFTDLPKPLQRGFLVDTGPPVKPTSIILQRIKERAPKEKILMDSLETIGNCTERLLSGEDPLTVFPDHHRGQVNLGVVPLRVRSLIEKIQRSGGAAKAARSGGDIGGVGIVFAVHPKIDVLKKVLRSAPVSLAYDPVLRRFISHAGAGSQHPNHFLQQVRSNPTSYKKHDVKKSTANGERASSGRQKSNILPHHLDKSASKADKIDLVPADGQGKVPDLTRQRRIVRPLHSTGGTEPVFSSEPLIAYKYDPGLGRDEEVVITVKTTLQIDKNHRQEEHMKRPNAQVFGREAARPYLLGIVAAFSLAHDRFDWTLAEANWAFSVVEPYGIDAWENKMALTTAQSVQLIDIETGDEKFFENSWLNQGHTVEFSADGKRLLVGSSGFDAVFEFDTTSGEVVWEWFAWDHGFDRSKLGHYVVRSAARYDKLAHTGKEVLLVDDPEKYKFGVPTRQSPAHLNCACYDSIGNILVTFFHQGAGYVVDRNTGEAQEVISGLFNPHKLSRRRRGGYFITDTRRGKLIFLDEEYRPNYEIALAKTPGIARSPQLSEYLQNTTELREDLFASIDIHRSSLWLIDIKRRRYRGIKFPVEWSAHDVASLEREQGLRIGSLVGTQFGKVAAFARQLKIIHHFSVEGREVTALLLDRQGRNRELDV